MNIRRLDWTNLNFSAILPHVREHVVNYCRSQGIDINPLFIQSREDTLLLHPAHADLLLKEMQSIWEMKVTKVQLNITGVPFVPENAPTEAFV